MSYRIFCSIIRMSQTEINDWIGHWFEPNDIIWEFQCHFCTSGWSLTPWTNKVFPWFPQICSSKRKFQKGIKMLFAYRGFIESAIFHKQDSTGHGNGFVLGLKTTCSWKYSISCCDTTMKTKRHIFENWNQQFENEKAFLRNWFILA